MKSAAKLLRGNVITSVVTVGVFTSVDVVNIFRGRISGRQLFKNTVNTAATVVGGTAGWLGGAAVGQMLIPIPGVGAVVGGLIGSIGVGGIGGKAANTVMGEFIEDDAEEMVRIIEKVFSKLSEEYLLNSKEAEQAVNQLQSILTGGLLKDMFASSNREEFAKNLRPFSDMEPIEAFLENFLEGEISDLPLPFAAWATDAESNEGVLLNAGKTARVLTASAAIPPFFRGVEIDGRKLYDGAYTNAIPADVCREMGADVVVAADLSAFVKPEEEKGRISRLLGSAINYFVPVKTLDNAKTRGYDAADVMLRPNLYDFKPTDVSRAATDAMFEIGYEEAKARIPEIEAAIKAAEKRKKR